MKLNLTRQIMKSLSTYLGHILRRLYEKISEKKLDVSRHFLISCFYDASFKDIRLNSFEFLSHLGFLHLSQRLHSIPAYILISSNS